jgi:hypothetical protein
VKDEVEYHQEGTLRWVTLDFYGDDVRYFVLDTSRGETFPWPMLEVTAEQLELARTKKVLPV